MPTKQQWIDYSNEVDQYAKDLKEFVKDLPDDDEAITESEGPGSKPPTPPPPPPSNP